MKKTLSLIFFTVVLGFAGFTQESKDWRELDEFHKVMAATFHPAEEGNLQPIRTRSAEMVEKAVAWKGSTAPKGYNQKAVSATLEKLVTGAKEIDKMVKDNAADKELVTRLSGLHDVFHEIMEKCRKEDHH